MLAFVHEHVDAALDPALRERAAETVEPAEVEKAERGEQGATSTSTTSTACTAPSSLLTLCLSHAVLPVDGASRGSRELMA